MYRNWLGLMRGTLEAHFDQGQRSLLRRLNPDRRYRTPSGAELVLPGRSLMLVRNVGHHMLSDAVTLDGAPIPETFIDAAVTSLIALHDLRAPAAPRNSRSGSVYIVKPKMHGPEEVAFADELFAEVEDLLALPRYTLKIGIMDEERRTTVNLAECIRAARQRVVFINTGFLDRTGDEIHTSMEAAAIPRKGDLKKAVWLDAYERNNVDVGLACGLPGHAQIGKGMWAMPDLMADMLKSKIAHPLAGANTAWVPSPTAATLHALHYHQVDVAEVQARLSDAQARLARGHLDPAAGVEATTGLPPRSRRSSTTTRRAFSATWCAGSTSGSAAPKCRITTMWRSWKIAPPCASPVSTSRTGCVTGSARAEQVLGALRRMAAVVDQQNASDPAYRPMSQGSRAQHRFQGRLRSRVQGPRTAQRLY